MAASEPTKPTSFAPRHASTRSSSCSRDAAPGSAPSSSLMFTCRFLTRPAASSWIALRRDRSFSRDCRTVSTRSARSSRDARKRDGLRSATADANRCRSSGDSPRQRDAFARRLVFVERSREAVVQQLRQRSIGETPAAGLAARAVIAFVFRVDDALHGFTANRAWFAKASMDCHLRPERRHLFGKCLAAFAAQAPGPLLEYGTGRIVQTRHLNVG